MGEPMAKTISINPVTRIEGHARITLYTGDDGKVTNAEFHVNEFRGFEKFCEGRVYTEMPTITPRICGICPTSHALASVKACEDIQQVKIPYTGLLLRRLIELGQLVSSHALSFYHLSAPDMLLGFDSEPASRNILGIAAKYPEIGVKGIRLRKFGQEISERLTGKKIHLMGIVAGGMAYSLREEDRQALLGWIPEALDSCKTALELFKKFREENKQFVDSFANYPTLYMGTVTPDGTHEVYDGVIRMIDENGKVLQDFKAQDYLMYIAERSMDFSYLKFPYFKPLGIEKGHYRVGPLARLNVASRMATPLAQKEFEAYKAITGGWPNHGTFYYHYARLIELLGAVEQVRQILEDPKVTSTNVQSLARRNQNEGIGSCEAPRGTLFHHYKVDDTGMLTKVNLLIATGQNNLGMNRSVLEVAKAYVNGKDVKEGALNRVEAAIRCYDPCLSCSTHAIGSMPMVMEVYGPDGTLLSTVRKDA